MALTPSGIRIPAAS
jgi:DNA replication protein DnaC